LNVAILQVKYSSSIGRRTVTRNSFKLNKAQIAHLFGRFTHEACWFFDTEMSANILFLHLCNFSSSHALLGVQQEKLLEDTDKIQNNKTHRSLTIDGLWNHERQEWPCDDALYPAQQWNCLTRHATCTKQDAVCMDEQQCVDTPTIFSMELLTNRGRPSMWFCCCHQLLETV